MSTEKERDQILIIKVDQYLLLMLGSGVRVTTPFRVSYRKPWK